MTYCTIMSERAGLRPPLEFRPPGISNRSIHEHDHHFQRIILWFSLLCVRVYHGLADCCLSRLPPPQPFDLSLSTTPFMEVLPACRTWQGCRAESDEKSKPCIVLYIIHETCRILWYSIYVPYICTPKYGMILLYDSTYQA